eukprot:jgi/Mesen1/2665/ME000167S01815
MTSTTDISPLSYPRSDSKSRAAMRDPSPTRVFSGPESVDVDSYVVHLIEWAQEWNRLKKVTLTGWQSWELPLPRHRSFWQSPRPEADIASLTYRDQGFAPYLLALFSTFPKNSKVCTGISIHMSHFMLWDIWLKNHGAAVDFAGLGQLFKMLRQRGVSLGHTSHTHFPERLRSKYPGKLESFIGEATGLEDHNWSRSWMNRYLAGWQTYAEVGLPAHQQVAALHNKGKTPSLDDFLVQQSLASGSWMWLVSAAANFGIPGLGEDAYGMALPLLSLGSMLVAVYRDVYVAVQGKTEAVPSVSTVAVYDLDQAMLIYNSLLAAFTSEKEAILSRASGGSTSSSLSAKSVEALSTFLDVLQASTHGQLTWFQFPSRFQGLGAKEVPVRMEQGALLKGNFEWAASHIDRAVRRASVLSSHVDDVRQS